MSDECEIMNRIKIHKRDPSSSIARGMKCNWAETQK